MRRKVLILCMAIFSLTIGMTNMITAQKLIPPSNPDIQYYGRWDKNDSLHYRHSWPGAYIIVTFTGTKIGVRLADNTSYYNVYIDGKMHSIFHSDDAGEKDYIIADSLRDTTHTLRFSKRNFSFNQIPVFAGFILDNNGRILPSAPEPKRKIEFVGDSFTAAEGNEAKELVMKWEDKFPVTNMDKGFAPLIAEHFGAQYITTCRSGGGMVCDWQGDTTLTVADRFDRTLMESPEPKWDFKKWIPDVVVICLGLNDHSGLIGKEKEVPDDKSEFFRKGYKKFLARVRTVYSGVKIVAVAAHIPWIQKNVKEVIDEQKAAGHNDVYYAQFGIFEGGYVANGHPTVETDKKIADEIINAMEKYKVFGDSK